MSEDEAPQPTRVGSTLDLARRMDRIEARHETLEAEVRTLTQTVGRVEQNQAHATELNKLRFDALDTGLKAVSAQLGEFINRIEAVFTGEVKTAAMREIERQAQEGQKIVADYSHWRTTIDDWREEVEDRFITADALEKAEEEREKKRQATQAVRDQRVMWIAGGIATLIGGLFYALTRGLPQ